MNISNIRKGLSESYINGGIGELRSLLDIIKADGLDTFHQVRGLIETNIEILEKQKAKNNEPL